MTITLQLSAEQERRLEEGAAQRDVDTIREILLKAVDLTVESLLASSHRPDPKTRRVLLTDLAAEYSDLPALSDEAVSRAGIYGDHA